MFYQYGDVVVCIQQLQFFFWFELLIGEFGLMDDFLEVIVRMGKMKVGMGGGFFWVDIVKDNVQVWCKDIVNYVFFGCMVKI